MSKLPERVTRLEQVTGDSGGTIIAILDDRLPLIDGQPWVKISNDGTCMPLDEFRAKYPDGVLMHIVFDVKPIGPLS